MTQRTLFVVLFLGCGTVGPGVPSGAAEGNSLESALRALAPPALPAPPFDLTNKFADDPRAARLGQKFFFDPGFSGRLLDPDNDGSSFALGSIGDTGRVSCAGCHLPGAGFQDNRSPGTQVPLGSGWGRRRTRSLLDVGHAKLVMWDGRKDSLQSQIFAPLESPLEMNSSRLYAAQHIFRTHRADYEALFGPMPPLSDPARFPQLSAQETGCRPTSGYPTTHRCDGALRGVPGDKSAFDGLSLSDQQAVTRVVVNMGKALAAYERLLGCGPSRFDAWVNGEGQALDAAEQRGAALFVGKGNCASCHSGPMLNDQDFHNVGLRPVPVAFNILDADDRGAAKGVAELLASALNSRGAFSDGDDGRLPAEASARLEGAFRVPTLRCVSNRPAYMHTGQLRSLEEVVEFFNRGGDADGFPGVNELRPLGLSPEERADLVAFLRALDGPGPAAALRQRPP